MRLHLLHALTGELAGERVGRGRLGLRMPTLTSGTAAGVVACSREQWPSHCLHVVVPLYYALAAMLTTRMWCVATRATPLDQPGQIRQGGCPSPQTAQATR